MEALHNQERQKRTQLELRREEERRRCEKEMRRQQQEMRQLQREGFKGMCPEGREQEIQLAGWQWEMLWASTTKSLCPCSSASWHSSSRTCPHHARWNLAIDPTNN